MLGVASFLLLGAVGLPLAMAGADSPPAWSGAGTVDDGVSLSDASLTSGPTGQTLLLTGAGAHVVTPGSVTAAAEPAGKGIAYLPDGDAVIFDGNQTLTYRFANGAIGSSAKLTSGVDSFAVNADELLVLTGGTQAHTVGAASFAIGTGGTLTANGGVVDIYTGDIYGPTAVALDPDGHADVAVLAELNDYSDQDPTEIQRVNQAGSAVWQTPHQLAADVNNGVQFVAAPGGRMLAAWTDYQQNRSTGADSEPDLYAAVRQPGGGFGGVQTLLSRPVAAAGYTDTLQVYGAAGPEGTLGLTATTDDCQNQSTTQVANSAVYAWVAASGGGLSETVIPGTIATSTHTSRVTAFAAGGGQALVALDNQDVTRDTSGTWVSNACGSETETGQTDFAITDSAALTGGGTHVFGSGTYTQGGNSSLQNVVIDSATMDGHGYATVIGSLDTPNAVQFATYGAVGSASPPVTTPTSAGPGPTPTNSQTSTASKPTTSASLTTGMPSPPLPQKPATVTTLPNTGVSNGVQTVTVTNTTDGQENLGIAELAYATGLTTQSPHIAENTQTKTVTIAKLTVHLKPHQKLRIKLHLSATARTALRNHHRLTVILRVVSTEKGYATRTSSKTLRLHAT